MQRAQLMAALGWQVARFQDASYAFDDAAAKVLALDRAAMSALSALLRGPLPVSELGDARERLEAAGYVRVLGGRAELTEHARAWIRTIWGPLEGEGARILAQFSDAQLRTFAALLEEMCAVNEASEKRLRKTLVVGRTARARGGLAPAAFRRVAVFVEAHLDRPLHLADLAERAGLSEFHFARAFKVTMGVTPRAFLEARRVERAKQLLRDTELPLAQLGLAVGLGSQSRFTTTFRRATGVTPAQYRRSVG